MNDLKQLLIAFFCCMTATAINAQCPAVNKAFSAGENLTYELYFNWKFVWVKAGTAKMQMTNDIYNGQQVYTNKLIATSNKRADFFFKMRDTLVSCMTHQMEPIYFRKGAEEGKRYTVDEAWFSYPDGKNHVKQRRLRHNGKVSVTDTTLNACVYDMLSILARARSFDPTNYRKGDKIHFEMATGRKVEKQTLIYRGKEKFRAEDDNETTYQCLVFSLVEYDKRGREIEVITSYVTDDDNHLPVRLDLYLNFGSAKAFLKKVKGNRHPLTSIQN